MSRHAEHAVRQTHLGAGLGLKPEHFEAALAARLPGLWFEIHPENYMVDGGPRLAWLETLRAEHPLSVHSVSLSLAGSEPLDRQRLQRLAAFVRRFEPALVSEHLAWSSWQGQYIPDLLPFARTTEALTHIAGRIDQMQTALGRTVAIENPTHYLQLPGHEWSEPGFLSELVRRTGCQLLLDLNNVLVSAHNLGSAPQDYLRDYPLHAVAELHLAGYSCDAQLGDALWVDSHDQPVAEATWALLRWVVDRVGPLPTLIERDGNVPPFDELLLERARAHQALQARAPSEAVA
jgi:hypothetical protein